MYYKAVVFDDVEIMHAIMNETDPKTMKRMGEEVRGFDQRKWFSVSIKVSKIKMDLHLLVHYIVGMRITYLYDIIYCIRSR